MSRITKRKHVIKEIMDDDMGPPTENQQIVKILSSRGNNLHEVLAPDQSKFLVSMPTKFRRNVWVKRGSYVFVEPIEEGDKVKAEIARILTNDHIKYLKKDKVWPSEFDDESKQQNNCDNSGSDDDELFKNTNRMRIESDVESSSVDGENASEDESTEDEVKT